MLRIGLARSATDPRLDAWQVAVGASAGAAQSSYAVAIGDHAGANQLGQAIAIGRLAGGMTGGATAQGANAIAIGFNAGNSGQYQGGIAIGPNAGYTDCKGIAIGASAGATNQGISAIAIGSQSGVTNQAVRSIILNATGGTVENTTADTCVIKPIRTTAATTNVLMYNTTSGEVSSSDLATVLAPRATSNNPLFTGVVTANDAMIRSWFTNTTAANVQYHMQFERNLTQGGGVCGYITTTPWTVAYTSLSDYRLKDVIGPVRHAAERLMALKPIRFAWKATGSEVDGFIAHEAQEVVPEAVTGTKDALDEAGNPMYQGIDQAKLVPLLVAALQEALSSISELSARVAALEAAV